VKKALTKEQTRLKLLDERYRKLFLTDLGENVDTQMIQTFFGKYGELEDVRVIVDQKKSKKKKKYGFVLYKEREPLAEVVKLGCKIEIAPGTIIDCKQTLLREELK